MDSVVKEHWRPELMSGTAARTFWDEKCSPAPAKRLFRRGKDLLLREKSLLLGPKDFLDGVVSLFRLPKACNQRLIQGYRCGQVFSGSKRHETRSKKSVPRRKRLFGTAKSQLGRGKDL